MITWLVHALQFIQGVSRVSALGRSWTGVSALNPVCPFSGSMISSNLLSFCLPVLVAYTTFLLFHYYIMDYRAFTSEDIFDFCHDYRPPF